MKWYYPIRWILQAKINYLIEKGKDFEGNSQDGCWS